jgi:predicted acetyltransferase
MTKTLVPEVRALQRSDTRLLAALFQFYVYDFSEFEHRDSNRLALNADGLFNVEIPQVDHWLSPGRWGYMISAAGHPAGFALVNSVSPTGRTIDFNMSEFFIARKYRRQNFGTRTVHDIFSRHLGRWEIGVIQPNVGARAFWPKAIAQAAGAAGVEMLDGSVSGWPGPVWTFSNAPASTGNKTP